MKKEAFIMPKPRHTEQRRRGPEPGGAPVRGKVIGRLNCDRDGAKAIPVSPSARSGYHQAAAFRAAGLAAVCGLFSRLGPAGEESRRIGGMPYANADI